MCTPEASTISTEPSLQTKNLFHTVMFFTFFLKKEKKCVQIFPSKLRQNRRDCDKYSCYKILPLNEINIRFSEVAKAET